MGLLRNLTFLPKLLATVMGCLVKKGDNKSPAYKHRYDVFFKSLFLESQCVDSVFHIDLIEF